ncbi:formin-homology 2 domain-containing protein, partial [Achlya hypogyna]
MNYLRRSNSSSGNAEGGSTAATAALRSIYSSTGSGQRALVFTVEVPERGPLGLDLKAPFSANGLVRCGAVVKGFRPNRHGKKGYIESTGRVREKDILVQLHDTRVDDMPFDAIVDLAAQLQDNPMAWPLRLEFKREPEVQEPEAKPKGLSSFFRSASISLPSLSSAPPTTAKDAQDGTFQDKLNYFRGFFKDRLPTSSADAKTKKVDIPPLPASDIVNDMYRELLVKRTVPDDVLDELVRIETLENKWRIVWSAKQHENDDGATDNLNDAIKIAEALVELHWDNKGLALLEMLHRKLAGSTAEWTDQFVVSYGLDYLTMKMPEPSPFSIEHHYKSFEKASRFCENIIRILLSLAQFGSGIDAITSTLGLVDRLALCFHTESSDVKKITLQVLGIICYNSAEGHQSVVHSFTNYKEVKGEMIRFTCLRDALKSTRYSLLFKEDVLSFINILVNKGLRVESRVEIRQDFVALGIGEYFEEIRIKSMAMYAKAKTTKKRSKKGKKKQAATTPPRSPRAPLPSPTKAPKLASPPLPPPLGRLSSTGLPPTTPKRPEAPAKKPLDEPLIQLPDIPPSPMPSLRSPVVGAIPEEPSSWGSRDSFGSSDGSEPDDPFDHLSSSDEEPVNELTPMELQIREQLDNMERQMEVFEVFMEDDRKSTLYGTTDLSSLESVVASLMQRVVLDDELRVCFLSILQQLLFIPADRALGKEMWAMCERVTKEIALLSPVEEVRRFELSFDDRKRLLAARDKFTAYLAEQSPELSFAMGPIELLRNRTPLDELSDESTDDEDEDSADDDIRRKYVRMLLQGMPLADVQREMQASTGISYVAGTRADASPALARFFKQLKAGTPLFKVQMQMQAEGLDGTLLERPETLVDDEGKRLPTPPATPVAPVAPATARAADHPTFAKYFKLLKMGMPLEHVKLKAASEGVDAAVLDTPDRELPLATAEASAPAGPPMVATKDHPKYAKYFKLLKMGMPSMQVELKMQAEGVDPAVLATPDALIPESDAPAHFGASWPSDAAKDHPKYTKYFKLLKMGMPAMQVELKMQAEGHDTSILATPDKMIPEKDAEVASAGPVLVAAKEHPKYAKYFKLLKMGMPAMQVELKMQAEGHDTSILATPDKMIPETDEPAPAAAGPVMVAVKEHP